jgi:hypothetical protein
MDGSSIAIVVVPTILVVAIVAIIWRWHRPLLAVLPVHAPVRAQEQKGNVRIASYL